MVVVVIITQMWVALVATAAAALLPRIVKQLQERQALQILAEAVALVVTLK